MAIGYGYDLKKRVVEAVVIAKMKIKDVVQVFSVGKSTIEKWLRDHKAGRDLHPKKNWQKGHSHKIKNLESFKEFVNNNPNLTTAKEIGEAYGGIPPKPTLRALKK